MKNAVLLLSLGLAIISCKPSQENASPVTAETPQASNTAPDSIQELDLKILDSRYISRDDVFKTLGNTVQNFSSNQDRINELNALVLEKNIPQLQQAIYEGKFTYEELTLFYLQRIYKYDRNNDLSLNAVIALNPNAIAIAQQADENLQSRLQNNQALDPYDITGMPILLKDNINTSQIPTTAGAAVLINNQTEDAQLVKNMRNAGAIILGKANLSEWAYFFCGDCPSGYSAVGGQTLNPYQRKVFDTGGSSSGSGVAVAANFAVAAVGSETSGSILSPSSQNSVVGLKPTVGTVSGEGVIPISSYLDTAGPMAKSVVDAAILLNAMIGAGEEVVSMSEISKLPTASLKGKRFGIFPDYLANPLFAAAIETIKEQGATVIELPNRELQLSGFIKLLNADMKQDLPAYFKSYGAPAFKNWDIGIVMNENRKDSMNMMPYGQRLFQGIVDEPELSPQEFETFKKGMTQNAQEYLNYYYDNFELDGILSINNYTAGVAAVGFFPAMSVPMGYDDSGEPYGLTFIAPTGQDVAIFNWAAGYERVSNLRKSPTDYQN